MRACAASPLLLTLALVVTCVLAVLLLRARRRSRDLEREVRAAAARMDTMSRLLGGIAHDFNNQLTVMMQAIGLLAGHPALAGEPAPAALLQALRESCAACARSTAQMLGLSRQQNLQPGTLDLGSLLAGLRPAFEHLAGAAIRIQTEVAQPAPVAFADRRQLETALLNLVGNACDAQPQGGGIVVRAEHAAPGAVRLVVVDSGAGIGGSGPGLSLLQEFAARSGGALRLHSEPGRGTTVELTLPAAPGAAVGATREA